MVVTNSNFLINCMRFHPLFLGVFARNELSYIKTNKHAYCFILNTDTNNLNGRHWIAVIRIRGKTFYFDPIGWLPIRAICGYLPPPIFYNSIRVQALLGENCGPHCIFYLYNFRPASSDYNAISFINKYLL